ncbi:MAG: VOC family protein [Ktedonobacteraceae bacterium]|nr:VOC family protein [Ktedonobacteraceae bacterium]
MNTKNTYVRHGFGTVRPYLYCHPDVLDCVVQVFGAEEVERSETKKGFHVEVRIGDSVVALEIGDYDQVEYVTRSSVYVYVEDVDATYQRAMQLGAISLAEPTDEPDQERRGGFKDTFGNMWWIGSYKGTK